MGFRENRRFFANSEHKMTFFVPIFFLNIRYFHLEIACVKFTDLFSPSVCEGGWLKMRLEFLEIHLRFCLLHSLLQIVLSLGAGHVQF